MRSDWKDCTLADLGGIVTGKTPSTKIAYYFSDKYPFITPRDIQVTKHVFSCDRYLSQSGINSIKSCLLPPNAICVSCIGNLGYVAMTTTESVTNQQINSIIPDCSNFDPDFIFYLIKFLNPYFKNLEGQSTTLSILNKTIFSKIPVKVPSTIDEQRSISKVLNILDDKIENNTKINHHLEQMAQAIFKSWFVDFEPWGGEKPSNWTIGTISDIATDIVCGKTPSTKVSEYFGDDMPFITIPDMHGVVYVTSTERSLSKAGAESQCSKTVPPNSVCVSCIATAGLVALTSVPSQTNQQINTIVCMNGISPFFVYLTMVGMADHIKMLGSSGSATNNLNKGQFSKIEILIPESDDMSEFSAIVESLFETISHHQQESARLAELRDTLLPRLMSGELSVTNLNAAK